MNPIKEEKQALREKFLALMKSISAEEQKTKSETIQNRVIQHPFFQKSQVIMLYASIQYEVLTEKIMEEAVKKGKQVILPRVDSNKHQLVAYKVSNLKTDLSRGVYGILEPRTERCQPCNLRDIQWILVPGLAFDKSGRRLGRGLGYYDRFLSQFTPTIPTAGLAYDYQITDFLPTDSHDVVLDEVISNAFPL